MNRTQSRWGEGRSKSFVLPLRPPTLPFMPRPPPPPLPPLSLIPVVLRSSRCSLSRPPSCRLCRHHNHPSPFPYTCRSSSSCRVPVITRRWDICSFFFFFELIQFSYLSIFIIFSHRIKFLSYVSLVQLISLFYFHFIYTSNHFHTPQPQDSHHPSHCFSLRCQLSLYFSPPLSTSYTATLYSLHLNTTIPRNSHQGSFIFFFFKILVHYPISLLSSFSLLYISFQVQWSQVTGIRCALFFTTFCSPVSHLSSFSLEYKQHLQSPWS